MNILIFFRYLVIIDSPTVESFEALIKIRDYIIDSSSIFDYDSAKEALDLKGQLNMEMIEFLANKRITHYEKLCVVQEKVGL